MAKKKTIWITSAAATAVLAVGGASAAVAVGGQPAGGGDDQPLSGSSLERAGQAALAEVGPGTVTDAETSDDAGSAYEVEVLLDSGGEVDVELDESFGVVRVGEPETDDDDDDEAAEPPLSAADRADAERAALAEVGAGTVTDVERDDDAGSGYEVEVALDDGGEVDVELDEGFQVVQVDTDQDD